MRVVTKFSFAAVMIASTFSLSTIAQASDWDHDRWREHERWEHEHRRVVEERPVYVAPRPVYVAPPPVVYAAPPAPSGLNLNFNIPLQ